MSLQTELNVMDTYRNFVTSRERKKEMDLVITADLRNSNRPAPTIEPEAESKKKKRFGF